MTEATDRDLLVEMKVRVTDIAADVAEMKVDVKRVNGSVGRHDLLLAPFAGMAINGKEATVLAEQNRTMWFWFGVLKVTFPILAAALLASAGAIITKVWF